MLNDIYTEDYQILRDSFRRPGTGAAGTRPRQIAVSLP